MRMNKFLLAFFGAAMCACSLLSSCEKDEDHQNKDLNDLAEQEEQVDEDSKKNANS